MQPFVKVITESKYGLSPTTESVINSLPEMKHHSVRKELYVCDVASILPACQASRSVARQGNVMRQARDLTSALGTAGRDAMPRWVGH